MVRIVRALERGLAQRAVDGVFGSFSDPFFFEAAPGPLHVAAGGRFLLGRVGPAGAQGPGDALGEVSLEVDEIDEVDMEADSLVDELLEQAGCQSMIAAYAAALSSATGRVAPGSWLFTRARSSARRSRAARGFSSM
jgi:hypothetical protein